jgi:hypothetical protein
MHSEWCGTVTDTTTNPQVVRCSRAARVKCSGKMRFTVIATHAMAGQTDQKRRTTCAHQLTHSVARKRRLVGEEGAGVGALPCMCGHDRTIPINEGTHTYSNMQNTCDNMDVQEQSSRGVSCTDALAKTFSHDTDTLR